MLIIVPKLNILYITWQRRGMDAIFKHNIAANWKVDKNGLKQQESTFQISEAINTLQDMMYQGIQPKLLKSQSLIKYYHFLIF